MTFTSDPSCSSPVIVALDFHNRKECEALVAQLNPSECRVKVGKEMFTLFGPSIVEYLQNQGFQVFLDLKFHDIPATVAKAVSAAADLGVWMVNVHASGGSRMLIDAAEALAGYQQKPMLIAVTVLTSMSEQQLHELGVPGALNQHVQHLAQLTHNAGLDGVVCSSREAKQLKASFGPEFKLVTPGIRPAGSAANDQTRVLTPQQAMAEGSDYLVIGRPITQAENPGQVCRDIIASLS